MNPHSLFRKICVTAVYTILFVALTAAALDAQGAQPPAGKSIRDEYPISYDKMMKTLVDITKPPNNPDPAARDRELALQKLKAYRFLSGVPYAHLKLDDKLNDYCQAATKVLQKLGKLDHNPPNPGLPEEEYQNGLKGCKSSNLAVSFPKANLIQSVDMWLFDSDPGNIVMLGHRNWCLNPSLGKTGFGATGTFSAMWSIDLSNPSQVDLVCFPAQGFQPIEYFGKPMEAFGFGYAWSVSLNTQKYQLSNNVGVQVFAVDLQGKKTGDALPLNYKAVSKGGFGMPPSIVFRPDKSAVAAGKIYLVEITGVTQKGGAAATISYPVEFVSLAAGAPKG